MKSFSVELKDLRPDRDEFMRAEVFYEDTHIKIIEDEFGNRHLPTDLSSYDRDIVERHLVLNLVSDENGAACLYCGEAVCV